MDLFKTIDIIKESFESWYNKNVSHDSPVSIIINYSDVQKLSLKAYHTVTMDMQAISINGDYTAITPLVKLEENYNHGEITEEEAKDNLTKKLLEKLYSFQT